MQRAVELPPLQRKAPGAPVDAALSERHHSALAPLALEAVPAALASGRPAAAWTAAAVSHARQPAAGHEAFRSSSQEGARTCSGR